MKTADNNLIQKLFDEDKLQDTTSDDKISPTVIKRSKDLENKFTIGDFSTKASETSTTVKKEPSMPVLSATISFVSTTMGSGWLTLPKAFATYGLGLGLIMMTFSGINGQIALKLFAKASRKYKGTENYAQLVYDSCGVRTKNLLNTVFTINLIGTLIAYTLVANTLVCTVFESITARLFGFNDDSTFHSVFSFSSYMVFSFITIPVQLMNNTSKFSNVGYLCIGTLFYIMILAAFQSNDYINHFRDDTQISFFKFNNPLLLLQDAGVFTFALYFMDTVFLIRNDMGSAATEKNIMKMGVYGIITMLIPFFAIGTLGYVSLGDAAINVDIFPERPALPGSSDILMSIGMIGIILSITLANLSRSIAMKCHIFDMMGKKITWKRNVIWTLVTMQIPSFIAFSYPAVNDWVSLLGAFCMATLLILLPGVIGMIIYKKRGENCKFALILIWVIVWISISYTSGILTLLKMVGIQLW